MEEQNQTNKNNSSHGGIIALVIIVVIAIIIGVVVYFVKTNNNNSNNNENQSSTTQGFDVNVYKLELAKNYNGDFNFDSMMYNYFRYYYEYSVQGNLEPEIYYDVNVQVAFYLGDEHIKTIEENFHLQGTGYTSKKGYVVYYLDDYYKYSDILQLPIVKQKVSSKVVKVSWE